MDCGERELKIVVDGLLRIGTLKARLPGLWAKPPYFSNTIIRLIAEQEGFTVTVREHAWDSYRIRGTLWRYGDGQHYRADVHIPLHRDDADPLRIRGITTCQQRFVALKEAVHLLSDSEGDYIAKSGSMVGDLICDNSGGFDALASNDPASRSEGLAKILALELLFPMSQREAFRAEIQAGRMTYYDVARTFMVPEKEVMWALRTGEHEWLCRCHADADRKVVEDVCA